MLVFFQDLSEGGRGAQMFWFFFPALCRLQGQSPNSFPVIVLCSQLGHRERPLTRPLYRQKLKGKMTATPPQRNVTFVTLSFSFFIVFDILATFSGSLLRVVHGISLFMLRLGGLWLKEGWGWCGMCTDTSLVMFLLGSWQLLIGTRRCQHVCFL